jgi:predicted dinucleotide-binding enzyme
MMSKITIVASGNVGTALGKGWMKNHEVIFGIRDLESPKVKRTRELIPDAKIENLKKAIEWAEVVVFTTPPEAVLHLVTEHPTLKDKLLIDATNSVRTRPEPFPTAFHALKELLKNEQVVKCFNSTGFENMTNPNYGNLALDMFMAGNDKASKEIVKALAIDLGFENCYDFGGDDKVELLEKFALSWINLAIMQGLGRNIGFKVVKRN